MSKISGTRTYDFSCLDYACYGGNLEAVKYLVETKCWDPTQYNKDGNSPLHMACAGGSFDVVQYLVKTCGSSLTHKNEIGLNSLHWTVLCTSQSTATLQYCIANGLNPLEKSESSQTAFHIACLGVKIEMIKCLINANSAGLRIKDKFGMTPFLYGCKNGLIDVVKCLLEDYQNDFNPSAQNAYGVNAIHFACMNDHLNIVQLCASGRTTIHMMEQRDFDGNTPLMYAATYGHTEILRNLILKEKCNIKHKNKENLSAYDLAKENNHSDACMLLTIGPDLHCDYNCPSFFSCHELRNACLTGKIEKIRRLIQSKKMRPQCKDKSGKNSLHYASEGGQLEIVKYLTEFKECDPISTDTMKHTALHHACKSGSLDTVKYLVQFNKAHQCNEIGQNCLHLACIGGDTCIDILSFILDNKLCDLRSTDAEGRTGFHLSCLYGNVKMVDLLVKRYGCLLTDASSIGQSALHFASLGGHLSIIKHFESLDNSIMTKCITMTDASDNTPLHYACQNGHVEIVKFYLSTTLQDINIKNKRDQYPHDMAWVNKHFSVVLFIVSAYKDHCDVSNLRNDNGFNLAHCASEHGDLDVVKYLMEGDLFNPFLSTNYGMNGLHYACMAKNGLDVVKLLASNCSTEANIQDEDSHGYSPLHYACQSGSKDTVEFFLSKMQCNIGTKTLSGDTPLHIATRHNQLDVVDMLLSRGGNPQIQNNGRKTPLAIAKERSYTKMLEHFHYYFGAYTEHSVESYVKVFIVGDHDVGKSTLFINLQDSFGIVTSLYSQFMNVSKVRKNSAIVEYCMVDSDIFRKTQLYDLAGQEEYYTCKAAFFGFFTASVTGIFLIVVKIHNNIREISDAIQKWLSFIEGSCSKPEQRRNPPHVIIVGSYSDKLPHEEVYKKYEEIEDILSKFSTSMHTFLLPAGIVCLDCRRRASPERSHLCKILKRSCKSLRKGRFSLRSRLSEVYKCLLDSYGTKLCHTTDEVIRTMRKNQQLISVKTQHFKELSDAGVLYYFKDKDRPEKNWVIGRAESSTLFGDIAKALFCRTKERKRKVQENTGVLPFYLIKKVLNKSDDRIEMVLNFWEFFQFSHKLHSGDVVLSQADLENQTQLDSLRKELEKQPHYYFPALHTTELKTSPLILQDGKFEYRMGLCFSCKPKGDRKTFPSRFLHVILLRLAFSYTAEKDETKKIKFDRKCTWWKKGISWSQKNGITVHFEVSEESTCIYVIVACKKDKRLQCLRLRSQIINCIRNCHNEICQYVPIQMNIIDPSDLIYPLKRKDELILI